MSVSPERGSATAAIAPTQDSFAPTQDSTGCKRREEAAADVHNKRIRSAVSSVLEEYICPITRELPLRPVAAEDGRIYEGSAIEKWVGQARPADQPLRSPVTNEPMGPRLVPAVQVRNSIELLANSMEGSDPLAAHWMVRRGEEKAVAEMRQAAEGGHGPSAFRLGRWYHEGKKGLVQDNAQAWMWWKRGAELRDTKATCACAVACAQGHGVPVNDTLAVYYYMLAAHAGSEYACFQLGCGFANGKYGLPTDKEEARWWFEKMPACTERAHAAIREKAAAYLCAVLEEDDGPAGAHP
jgi:TPR repeat protein